MKLKLYRQSGAPVDLEVQEAYKKDWQEYYDKADERARDKHKTGAFTDQYALLMQRYLSFGQRLLTKKYGSEVIIEAPKTQKGWNELITKHYDTPIMLAKTQDGKSIVGIIMDNLS